MSAAAAADVKSNAAAVAISVRNAAAMANVPVSRSSRDNVRSRDKVSRVNSSRASVLVPRDRGRSSSRRSWLKGRSSRRRVVAGVVVGAAAVAVRRKQIFRM
jgi:hypothetical protein